ncbi:cytosolic sulfotransferase 15-like [Durio zibethinus]|uniref:Sulfotransferase n=1 Tax=Durio zibethinus TaxID=66656 RepID=A0A6P5WUZ2_DURZI|nr:cytosolic sulfotransferase 15-like [Durio zibethinus]
MDLETKDLVVSKRQDDEVKIYVSSSPKCGTTWIKALTFSIVNRNQFAMEETPLRDVCPHQLVPYFENPRDTFISHWIYANKLRAENVEPLSLDEAFEKFCQGINGFGPFFDHVLGYWNASQENPNKILFLQYEDLKEDIVSHVKRLAMFLGFPFTDEEEKHGTVEEIVKTCSFGNLKELDVNKNGIGPFGTPNNYLFRKAEVGDWSNYLTPAMVERFEKLTQENMDKSGLTFRLS